MDRQFHIFEYVYLCAIKQRCTHGGYPQHIIRYNKQLAAWPEVSQQGQDGEQDALG